MIDAWIIDRPAMPTDDYELKARLGRTCMPKWGKIAVGIVAVTAIGWGGLALNHSIQCRGYEEGYLNAVSSLKSSAMLSGVVADDELADELSEMQRGVAKFALQQVYDECGLRAGQTASRKGTELLF